MIVGFTGTREGCTVLQLGFLELILREKLEAPWSVLHQGCCVGADAQAVAIARRLFGGDVMIVGHPGNWGPLVDKDAVATSHPIRPERPPLDRNRTIVDECEVLVACPAGPEVTRSGTWSTIRYARRIGKPVVIIYPDGTVDYGNAREKSGQSG